MDTELCPCCGGRRDPELFAAALVVPRPLVLAEFLDADTPLPREHELRVIELLGRRFLRCGATLPFVYDWAALRYGLWVEINRTQYAEVQAVYAGELAWMLAEAPLACEWPGMPGTIGTACTVSFQAGGEPVVVDVEHDTLRLAGLDPEDRHAELASLYRAGLAALAQPNPAR